MSIESDPVPPLPATTPVLNDNTGNREGNKKLFENNWQQWFLNIREKINIINALMVSISKLTSTGFIAISGGVAATRELLTGPGVDVSNGDGSTGDPQFTFNAATGEVAHLTGATYKTVQKFIDVMSSPGIITGGEITELTTTSVRITAGTAIVRIADDNVSELRLFDFASQDFSVPDVQVTHFYALDYNGGSPTIVESTGTETWDRDTEIPLGSALRGDGLLNITPNPYRVGDVITNLIQRLDAIGPVQRDNSVGGLALGETGTRNVTVSAGRLWSRVSDFSIPSKNSSVDTMATVYFNGVNLTVTSGITQWDNLNFNNLGTGLLQVMGNNKYANLWFFMAFNGDHYGFAYGTNEYNTLGDAANESIPSYLTQNFFNQFILLGRFIFQKSAATASIIESAFVTPFSAAAINTHNNLGGLQGGTAGEFYHLTLADYTKVTALPAASQPLDTDLTAIAALAGTGFAVRTAADTWAQRSFPDGTGFTWTNGAGIAGDPTLVLNVNLQAWSAITTASKADDSAVVHIVGTETITGLKTFQNVALIQENISNSDGPTFALRRSRVGPAALLSNDRIGVESYQGWTGAAYMAGASVESRATENWSSTTTGAKLELQTTATGTTGRTTRFTVDENGDCFLTGGRLYGTALHNNASAVTGTTNQYVASGTYTPTLTNVTNAAASVASVCQWMRVGNVVTVSGRLDVTPTAGGAAPGTLTRVDISLPIASNFTVAAQLGGGGGFGQAPYAAALIIGDTVNDRAIFQFYSTVTVSTAGLFTFTYVVV